MAFKLHLIHLRSFQILSVIVDSRRHEVLNSQSFEQFFYVPDKMLSWYVL